MDAMRNRIYRWLKWSEKYTKTDMVYLARGGFWLTLSQVISSLVGLVLAIAFANLISDEIYGTYRYVLSIISILGIATFPGLSTAAINGVSRGDEQVFWQLLKRKGWWSLASTVLSLVLAAYYFFSGNVILAAALLIAALCLPLTSASGMYAALLNGRKDFKRMAQMATLVRVVTAALMTAVLFVTNNVLIFIAIYFIPEFALETGFLFHLYRRQRLADDNRLSLGKLTNFGWHLSVMEILKTIAGQIDKVLVFHYLGAGQLAIYTILSTAPSQIKSVMQNLTTLALPKLSNTDNGEATKTLPAKLFRLELLILLLVSAYWLLAPVFFPVFFPKYVGAVFLSQIYALSLIFFPRTFLSTAMTARLKQKELYAIRFWSPAARIIIFLIALPLWGLWGAVIGSILNNAANAWIYQHYYKKAFADKYLS